MTTEAEQLAIELMNYATCTDNHCDEAAFLLRKLQAENEALLNKVDFYKKQAILNIESIEALRVRNDKLVEELWFIAYASTCDWDNPTEFKAWAQNRARAAIKGDTATVHKRWSVTAYQVLGVPDNAVMTGPEGVHVHELVLPKQ